MENSDGKLKLQKIGRKFLFNRCSPHSRTARRWILGSCRCRLIRCKLLHCLSQGIFIDRLRISGQWPPLSSPPSHIRIADWDVVLIFHSTIAASFEKPSQWEPQTHSTIRSRRCWGDETWLIVGIGMIVHEHAGADVEGYEHIDGIMLMCCENEEYTKSIHNPGGRMKRRPWIGSVFCDEIVEQCQHRCMPTEHIVATGSNTLHRHSGTGENDISLTKFLRKVTVSLNWIKIF